MASTLPPPAHHRGGRLQLCAVLFRGDPAPTWPDAWDFLADYPDHAADGVAIYALTDTDDPDWPVLYLRQPFQRGAGRTDPAHGHVWGWNGHRTLYDPDDPGGPAHRLSLTPSFAWNPGRLNPRHPYVHLFLRDGRVVDAGDSTCAILPNVGPPAPMETSDT